MAYQCNEGYGSLFRTKEKNSEKHPDYTGDAMLDGNKVRLAGWIKETRNGDKFLSLTVKWDEERESKEPASSPVLTENNEDLPF